MVGSSANCIRLVEVEDDGMVEPKARIGIGVCPIGILKAGPYPSDCAVCASNGSVVLQVVLHSIVYIHRRHDERSVVYFDSFGAMFGEELRLQGRYIGRRIGVWFKLA